LTRKSEDVNLSQAVPRESNNPIVEDYREELLKRTTYRAGPVAAVDESRLSRLKDLLAELCEKVENLDRRLNVHRYCFPSVSCEPLPGRMGVSNAGFHEAET